MLVTISMEFSILYLKGSEFHIKCISFIHEDCFYLSNLTGGKPRNYHEIVLT